VQEARHKAGGERETGDNKDVGRAEGVDEIKAEDEEIEGVGNAEEVEDDEGMGGSTGNGKGKKKRNGTGRSKNGGKK
jgi:hypothetical protein